MTAATTWPACRPAHRPTGSPPTWPRWPTPWRPSSATATPKPALAAATTGRCTAAAPAPDGPCSRASRMLEVANLYLQCHVACDEFDVIGLTSPGVPGFPHFAHNRDVAWCVTVAFVDT